MHGTMMGAQMSMDISPQLFPKSALHHGEIGDSCAEIAHASALESIHQVYTCATRSLKPHLVLGLKVDACFSYGDQGAGGHVLAMLPIGGQSEGEFLSKYLSISNVFLFYVYQ